MAKGGNKDPKDPPQTAPHHPEIPDPPASPVPVEPAPAEDPQPDPAPPAEQPGAAARPGEVPEGFVRLQAPSGTRQLGVPHALTEHESFIVKFEEDGSGLVPAEYAGACVAAGCKIVS